MPDDDHAHADPTPGASDGISRAPYEGTLMKAFEKLTSEVLIFLLAYLALLIGLGTLAPSIVPELRILFYVLPVLAIAGYLLSRRRTVRKDAKAHGVSVVSGVASGRATVTGVRGDAGGSGTVKVRSGVARDSASITGIDADGAGASVGERYLLETFRELGSSQRRQLIAEATRLVEGGSARR